MSTNSCGLTDREVKLMSQAWQCFDDNPKINFDKLAALGGYTNPKSCVNAWSAIKKKLANAQSDKSATGTDGDGEAPQPKPKAMPRKRGKKAVDEDGGGGDVDGEDDESPAKKAKATPKKRAATPKTKKNGGDENVVKTENEDEDAGEDLIF